MFTMYPKNYKLDSIAVEPTSNELWNWTLSREAIASCFIKDTLAMREDSTKDIDFYWLGRVPCRTVKIAGLLVGIQIYEKRIRYIVDDGTGVIDCLHKQSPPRSPTKNLTSRKGFAMDAKPRVIHPSPKPVARVGNSVLVTGRVVIKYETRELVVDSIEQVSQNDEVRHWAHVHQLHVEHYSLSTPFEIPTPNLPSSPSELSTNVAFTTPSKSMATRVRRRDVTSIEASTCGTTVSRAMDSPSTQMTPSTIRTISPSSSRASSPAKSTATRSPQKLRHPSRLHSRDLNGNTFRIYVKHYMDYMAYVETTIETDDEFDANASFIGDCPITPTKLTLRFATDATPRANPLKPSELNKTPRPRISPLSNYGQSCSQHSSKAKGCPIMRGFTISYLRRVPELADMARRVVKVVAKRRLREERQKVKEAAAFRPSNSTQAKSSTGYRTNTAIVEVEEKNGPRIKRLFQATIVQLLKEGSIVLWEGPKHMCPIIGPNGQVSLLWKANVTSTSADSTLFSTTRKTNSGDEGEDILSEPESEEEAYVPLSPVFLAGAVEEAIRKLTRSPTVRTPAEGKKQEVTRYGATTKEGILAFLKKDDRWRYLSEWNIREALDVLKMEHRAWCVGRGLWELSI